MSGAPWNRALVVGLGKSGLAAARLLGALGVEVWGYDQRAKEAPAGVARTFGGDAPGAEAFDGVDLIVLSPGVPPKPVRRAAEQHAPDVPVHGELGLAMTLIADEAYPQWPATRTVLITGTNGKSTVTAMTGALLEAAGRRPFVGGNLGPTLCDVLTDRLEHDAAWPDDLVIECSSYQLETLPTVPTAVAMLLNITPDHLDRYDSFEHYARTKGRIFAGLGSDDLALVLDDDPWTDRLAPTHCKLARIGAPRGPRVEGPGAGQTLHLSDAAVPRDVLRLPGRHNAVNAVFAATAARHLGVTIEQCRSGLAAFEGLPHRMVLVRELDGVTYYNDSKATNVASALASLGGLDRQFVLIAGGKAKGDDLTPLGELLARRAKGLVVIGEAAEQFAALGEGTIPTERAPDLADAVRRARGLASPGQAVVLAPACASFDQFDSYAHRGRVFAEAVLALA